MLPLLLALSFIFTQNANSGWTKDGDIYTFSNCKIRTTTVADIDAEIKSYDGQIKAIQRNISYLLQRIEGENDTTVRQAISEKYGEFERMLDDTTIKKQKAEELKGELQKIR